MLTKTLTISAYARYRRERGLPGGAKSSVHAALLAGRISRSCPSHPRRCPAECRCGKIDPHRADLAWQRWTNPAMVRTGGAR
jgi:hypothetical protein